jgi:hypothetical protein
MDVFQQPVIQKSLWLRSGESALNRLAIPCQTGVKNIDQLSVRHAELPSQGEKSVLWLLDHLPNEERKCTLPVLPATSHTGML